MPRQRWVIGQVIVLPQKHYNQNVKSPYFPNDIRYCSPSLPSVSEIAKWSENFLQCRIHKLASFGLGQ
jgi:hypothetical protein